MHAGVLDHHESLWTWRARLARPRRLGWKSARSPGAVVVASRSAALAPPDVRTASRAAPPAAQRALHVLASVQQGSGRYAGATRATSSATASSTSSPRASSRSRRRPRRRAPRSSAAPRRGRAPRSPSAGGARRRSARAATAARVPAAGRRHGARCLAAFAAVRRADLPLALPNPACVQPVMDVSRRAPASSTGCRRSPPTRPRRAPPPRQPPVPRRARPLNARASAAEGCRARRASEHASRAPPSRRRAARACMSMGASGACD